MSRLVEVGRYDNALFAYRLVDVLADAGIEAEVMDENTGSALPYIGAIGVRVVVAEEDAGRAWDVIEADRRAPAAEIGASDVEADAIEPDDADGRWPDGGDEDGADDAAGSRGDADARPPPTAAEIVEGEIWARKTRDIAFVGLGVIVLAPVALYRVLRPPRAMRASPQALRHLRQARIMSIVGVGIGVLIFGIASLRSR